MTNQTMMVTLLMDNLDSIGESIQQQFEELNTQREHCLKVSRQLTRLCALTIRAIHRQEWDEVASKLEEASAHARDLNSVQDDYPDLYYTGYTQDALKEYTEAHLTYALAQGNTLPTPAELNVPMSTYINGLAEAGTEMRRAVLDLLRHDQYDKSEELLTAMEAIYTLMTTIDYPDAITGGLRRRTDVMRSVLERTRGDLTMSLRQTRLEKAIQAMSKRLSAED